MDINTLNGTSADDNTLYGTLPLFSIWATTTNMEQERRKAAIAFDVFDRIRKLYSTSPTRYSILGDVIHI